MIKLPDSTIIPGPAGDLEALVTRPKLELGRERDWFMVICHPNPLHGGTMHNKVVTMVAKACERLAVPTIRFNFRGTQGSAGEHDAGYGEIDDLQAVIAWGKKHFNTDRFAVSGFSFGAYVSAQTIHQHQASLNPLCLISISPCIDQAALIDPSVLPRFNRHSLREITQMPCPWLVLMGEADEVVKPDAVFDFVAQSPVAIELVKFPDTSHFYHSKLVELRSAVMTFLEKCVPSEE